MLRTCIRSWGCITAPRPSGTSTLNNQRRGEKPIKNLCVSVATPQKYIQKYIFRRILCFPSSYKVGETDLSEEPCLRRFVPARKSLKNTNGMQPAFFRLRQPGRV